jgi:uncharacterized protein
MKTVDAYIDGLSVEHAAIAKAVRNIIHEQVPGVQEKLSFKIPFYHYFGMFCYINLTGDGIDVGFCRGKDLVDEFPQLQVKKRAIVASISLTNRKDIARLHLREIITAAAIWNETAKKNKIPMVARKGVGR